MLDIVAFAVATVAVLVLLAYFQAPILLWTVATGLMLATWASALQFSAQTNAVLFFLFILIAPVLAVPVLRRILVSDHVLAIFRRILPDMTQTEKDAIDAGTVWWDADLFSGKPDWNKMLAIPVPGLSAEEKAFLDGPCEEICAMTNDWEVTHERYDLSPQVWQYAKDKGYTELFARTGVQVIKPGCGACIGCGPGVSDRGDQVTVSAINRNYKGRSGPGKLYLASPLTVAASAVTGEIVEYKDGMFGAKK